MEQTKNCSQKRKVASLFLSLFFSLKKMKKFTPKAMREIRKENLK